MRNFERQANRIAANSSKQGEQRVREMEEKQREKRIRSLESPTNMSASSVPEGVIDRLGFLNFRLRVVWIRLCNIPKDKFSENNRKRLYTFD